MVLRMSIMRFHGNLFHLECSNVYFIQIFLQYTCEPMINIRIPLYYNVANKVRKFKLNSEQYMVLAHYANYMQIS